MKFFCSILLILILVSCGSTKKSTEITSKTIVKKEVVNKEDSFPLAQNKVVNPTVENEQEIVEEPIPEHDTTLLYLDVFDHSTWNKLLSKHVSINGTVDYKGFQKNRKELLLYFEELNNNRPTYFPLH